MNSQIFGSETAKPLEFAWIGSQEHLNKNGSSDSEYGACLIIDEWALTATYFMGPVMKIVFGEQETNERRESKSLEEDLELKKVTIFHNKYYFEYKNFSKKFFFRKYSFFWISKYHLIIKVGLKKSTSNGKINVWNRLQVQILLK